MHHPGTATPSTVTSSSPPSAMAFWDSRPRHDAVAERYCERAIGVDPNRRCLDHVVVFGERHLRHPACDLTRTRPTITGLALIHFSQNKDARGREQYIPLAILLPGPFLGGLQSSVCAS